MKVILRKDVANVGRKGEVKEVSNGYAQNFLIGRGLADLATPAKIRAAEAQAQRQSEEQQAAHDALTGALEKLGKKSVVIHASANEKNHLFEAVSMEVVATHLKEVVGVEVDAGTVVADAPIKELGEHTVHVITGEAKVPIKIDVQNT